MPRRKQPQRVSRKKGLKFPGGMKNSAFFVFGLILLIFFSVSLTKEIIRSYEIKGEIDKLQTEIGTLEKRNQELANLVQYLNTDLYREKEARLRLNVQEPGEQVVAVPAQYLGQEDESVQTQEQAVASSDQSNPQKWWSYFFRHSSYGS